MSILNIIFNQRNTTINFDKWMNEDLRVLFVTGLSGGGKTTTSIALAELLDVKVVSLDQYIRPLVRKEFGLKQPNYERAYYEQGIEILLKDNPYGRLIIEGAHIEDFDPSKLKDHALIIVRTSLIASCWRAIKRNLQKEHLQKHNVKTTKQWISNLTMALRYNLKNFRKHQQFVSHFG